MRWTKKQSHEVIVLNQAQDSDTPLQTRLESTLSKPNALVIYHSIYGSIASAIVYHAYPITMLGFTSLSNVHQGKTVVDKQRLNH